MRFSRPAPILVLAVALLAVTLVGGACRPSVSTPERVGDSGAVPSLGSPAAPRGGPTDGARVDSLERAARALARTDGCRSAGDCRAAPLGAKACGGPRDYLVYCARTTDTIALFHALAALERAERAANASSGAIGTCELRLPPVPVLTGGACGPGEASGVRERTDRSSAASLADWNGATGCGFHPTRRAAARASAPVAQDVAGWHRSCAFGPRSRRPSPSSLGPVMHQPSAHCTFCDLIAGAAEVSVCYEDADAIAFMDIQPVNPGHLLVVPRRHYESLADIPAELAMHLFTVATRLAPVVLQVAAADGMNIVVNSGAAAGQDVFHYHVHVIPRREGDGFDVPLPFAGSTMPERERLDAAAARIIAALRDPMRGPATSASPPSTPATGRRPAKAGA